MALDNRKVSISYRCLLRQIMQHLGFPDPMYFSDNLSTTVRLEVDTPDLGPFTYTYEGAIASNLEAMCEKAAEIAVRDLRDEYDLCIRDLTYERTKKLERCANLFDLKLARLEQTKNKECDDPSVTERKGSDIYIDYLDVLHVLRVQTAARVSKVESLDLDGRGFVAWLTVYCPEYSGGLECIIGDRCLAETTAKQNVAKKTVSYIQDKCHIDITDVNYGTDKYAGIKCALARESCMAAAERVLGIQGPLHLAPFLSHSDCSTPTSLDKQVVTISSPPAPPRKRKSRPGFGSISAAAEASGSTLVKVPPQLDLVFRSKAPPFSGSC